MPGDVIQIKRYPNRRYYARHTSQYVSLREIEEMVQSGETVEIRDSQSGDDLTRTVLTQIIMERQPDKMSLFPADMLHCIVRSNDAMSGFLRDYFHHSLTYLNYLQRHGAPTPLHQPIHWVKAWLDGIAPQPVEEGETEPEQNSHLAQRVRDLEERLRELESKEP
jgi:polyhydroxyalkanoate synthesis repressor PhaR